MQLTDQEIDRLIDAEYGTEPVSKRLRRLLRADARQFGNVLVLEEGSKPVRDPRRPDRPATAPGFNPRPVPEIRWTPALVIKARHLGWSGAQLSIEAVKRAMPWAEDIEFAGHVDRNN
jgi:hypothetical protein